MDRSDIFEELRRAGYHKQWEYPMGNFRGSLWIHENVKGVFFVMDMDEGGFQFFENIDFGALKSYGEDENGE